MIKWVKKHIGCDSVRSEIILHRLSTRMEHHINDHRQIPIFGETIEQEKKIVEYFESEKNQTVNGRFLFSIVQKMSLRDVKQMVCYVKDGRSMVWSVQAFHNIPKNVNYCFTCAPNNMKHVKFINKIETFKSTTDIAYDIKENMDIWCKSCKQPLFIYGYCEDEIDVVKMKMTSTSYGEININN